MNGKQTDDTDDPESIDTDEERSITPLRDGAQLIKNPQREGFGGETTVEQEAGIPLVTVTGQDLEDGECYVQVIISVAAAKFVLWLDTETARALSTDLDIAARGAEDPEEARDEL
jgi:hypothetical protein